MLRTVITVSSPLGISSQSVHLAIGNEATKMDELDEIDFISRQISEDVVEVTLDASFSGNRKAAVMITHYVERLNSSLVYMYGKGHTVTYTLFWTNITTGKVYEGIGIDSINEYLEDAGFLEAWQDSYIFGG